MKSIFATISVVALSATSVFAQTATPQAKAPTAAAAPKAAAPTFRLTSADIKNGAFASTQVLNNPGLGCSGGNVSPQLAWTGAPAGTKSFVVTMYDPDAPTGSGFWHWVVFNIPATVAQLPNGASKATTMPAGAVEGRTDLGAPGYGGPCPPAGSKHRYVFTIYALKVERIDLDNQASAAMVGFMTLANALGKATFTVIHGR